LANQTNGLSKKLTIPLANLFWGVFKSITDSASSTQGGGVVKNVGTQREGLYMVSARAVKLWVVKIVGGKKERLRRWG